MTRRFFQKITFNWHVKLISLALAAVLWFYVQSLQEKERFITALLEVKNVPEGFVVSGEIPPSVKVILRGKENSLSLVSEDAVKAFVDAARLAGDGGRGTVNVDRSKIPPGVLVREVEPRSVAVSLEAIATKKVEIVPVIAGQPAQGFLFENAALTPDQVYIRGPASAVDKVEVLRTREINIGGLSKSTAVEVELNIEIPGISVVEGAKVRADILLAEEFAVKTYENVPVVFLRVKEGLKVTGERASATLILKVSKNAEITLSPEQLRVYADCSAVERPGKYLLPLAYEAAAEGVSLVRVEPQNIAVRAELLRVYSDKKGR